MNPSFTILKLYMPAVVDAAVNHHLFLCNLPLKLSMGNFCSLLLVNSTQICKYRLLMPKLIPRKIIDITVLMVRICSFNFYTRKVLCGGVRAARGTWTGDAG